MVILRPFRALHYNTEAVGDLAAVIAPPYDVIDDAHLERLYARHRHNVVRLILNREADRYSAAAAEYSGWRERKILVQDSDPCLYYYVQDFRLPDGSSHQREGLIAAVRLQAFSEGHIRPHERTFARAKEDRLKLVRACRANLSPLFGLYANRARALDPARELRAAQAPWLDVVDEFNERHRVWRVCDPASVTRIAAALQDGTIFIADGHHRYETSLNYREERAAAGGLDPASPVNFVLMYLASMDDPGLVILPTHRVIRRLPEGTAADLPGRLASQFDTEEFPCTGAGQESALRMLARETRPGCFLLRTSNPDRLLSLRLRDPAAVDEALKDTHPAVRRLDVSILDAFLLARLLNIDCGRAGQEGALTYTHSTERAFAAVADEGAPAAFLLRATRTSEVEAVCMSGEVMPQKSTYFYPKLLSGLVFHSLEDDAGAAS